MGKIIFWIVVAIAVMLVMRMVNLSKARARREADQARAARPTPAAMVRCADCGVFLPRTEAREVAGRFHCGQPGCTAPHSRRR